MLIYPSYYKEEVLETIVKTEILEDYLINAIDQHESEERINVDNILIKRNTIDTGASYYTVELVGVAELIQIKPTIDRYTLNMSESVLKVNSTVSPVKAVFTTEEEAYEYAYRKYPKVD